MTVQQLKSILEDLILNGDGEYQVDIQAYDVRAEAEYVTENRDNETITIW